MSVTSTVSRGLNIAALAQRTGVAPDTLRKWEQRYGILRPERTPGGQRRYSERDVARIEWLQARLAEGYRIGEAAQLLGNVAAGRTPAEHVEAILAAADRADSGEVGLRLDQAFALHPVDTVLRDVVAPLLEEIGERWSSGAITVAQEHLVSESVRSRLGHLIGDVGGGVRGVVVLACAPGERHELGLMTVAIALRTDGWKVAYVGADTPLADACELARSAGAAVLGVSVCVREHTAGIERELSACERPDGLQLVVGGAAASKSLAKKLGGRHLDGDLDEIVRGLRALAA